MARRPEAAEPAGRPCGYVDGLDGDAITQACSDGPGQDCFVDEQISIYIIHTSMATQAPPEVSGGTSAPGTVEWREI